MTNRRLFVARSRNGQRSTVGSRWGRNDVEAHESLTCHLLVVRPQLAFVYLDSTSAHKILDVSDFLCHPESSSASLAEETSSHYLADGSGAHRVCEVQK